MNFADCHSYFDKAAAAAVSHWSSILPTLGIPSESLIDRHQPCPGCGGLDRFRFDDRHGSGSWYCSGGSDGAQEYGDGFDLLQHVHGWSAADALKAVAGVLSIDSTTGNSAPIRRKNKPTEPKWMKRDTSSYGKELFLRSDRSDSAVASHQYAGGKGLTHAAGAGHVIASGKVIGQGADCVCVPIRDLTTGRVEAAQCINTEGAKQTFGGIRGHGLILGNDSDVSFPILVFEGWASAAAWVFLIEKGNACAVAAFGKSNMLRIAERLAEIYRDHRVVTMQEDDSK